MPIEGDSTAVPGWYSRVDPWVISRDSDAEIEFLRRAFGAQERPSSRVRNPDGRIGHVEVELAGSVVLMFDAQPGWPSCRRTCGSMWTTSRPPSTTRWRRGRGW
jgi:PhnB protein